MSLISRLNRIPELSRCLDVGELTQLNIVGLALLICPLGVSAEGFFPLIRKANTSIHVTKWMHRHGTFLADGSRVTGHPARLNSIHQHRRRMLSSLIHLLQSYQIFYASL
jgi:hypothetical protein